MDAIASAARGPWPLMVALVAIAAVSPCSSSGSRDESRVPPPREDVCSSQLALARATIAQSGTSNSRAAEEVEKLIAIATSPILPIADLRACRDQTAVLSYKLARAYHRRTTKQGGEAALASAQRLYERYIATFPGAKDIDEVRFFYAELLWARAERETDPRLRDERWQRAMEADAYVKHIRHRLEANVCVLPWRHTLGDAADDKAGRE